ncbi:putative protein disulfide-isomerase precursor [Fusarium austroafricanum]|uniref:Protein disulfide-isomerase n=1 Tax=Fusarium austroafricanum TaxID=2364996 RepID=A0A8H4JKQ0_9HYPO|nr:putative protein disulfide-isomerase precursor [Fusarium austroafricanum]
MRLLYLVSLVALCTPTATAGIKLRRTEFNVLVSSRQALILFTADGLLAKTAIASINCNDEAMVCDDAQVLSVPTLKFTTGNGNLVTYKEALDESSIVKYIERQSGSPVTDLTKKSHIDFATSARVAVVAFLGTAGHEEERKTFNTVAERWRTHYSFGSVNSFDRHGTEPSIAVYTQEQDDPVYYRGAFNEGDIETFLRDATIPLIGEFDPVAHAKVVKEGKPLAQIFFSQHKERVKLVKSLIPLAKKYKDQISFMTVLVSDYPARCKNFDEFVYDKSRDVLVEFHVPWCQYCTELQVQMNELGSKYSKSGLSKKISIAAIDVDANDVPIEINSYPSIRLYRAGTNEIVSFTGNFTQMLTEKQLDDFVSTSGSYGISLFDQDKARNYDEL